MRMNDMTPVKVRNITVGEGKPVICVPVVGTDKESIIRDAADILHSPADLMEWRADWFHDVNDINAVLDVLQTLRETVGELPVLMTFRTKAEGGEREISADAYAELCITAAKSGLVDLIDAELFSPKAVDIIQGVHEAGIPVIVSSHDFEKTPDTQELMRRLRLMDLLGGDILKIAVMPKSRKDVLTLLEVTEEMSSVCTKPLVTMAMSGLGTITRISGEIFGSALTFGTVSKASAPGQMAADRLKEILDALHEAL